MSDCVGLHIRRNVLLRVKLKRARRVASGLAVMPAGTPVGFYFRCVGWLSAFMRIPDARCLIRFKSYVHLFLRLRAVCLCLVGLQVRRNGLVRILNFHLVDNFPVIVDSQVYVCVLIQRFGIVFIVWIWIRIRNVCVVTIRVVLQPLAYAIEMITQDTVSCF